MWLYDQRKRYDPLKQEIYRRRVEVYEAAINVIAPAVLGLEGVYSETDLLKSRESLLEVSDRMKVMLTKQFVVMHESVGRKLLDFIHVLDDLLAEAVPLDDKALAKGGESIAEVGSSCLDEMRQALGIEHADIDFAWWLR